MSPTHREMVILFAIRPGNSSVSHLSLRVYESARRSSLLGKHFMLFVRASHLLLISGQFLGSCSVLHHFAVSLSILFHHS